MVSVTTTKEISSEEALRRIRDMTKDQDMSESLREILVDLQRFEQTYGMSTLEFYARFRSGQMGDAEDFMVWASLYEAYVELTQPYLAAEKIAA